MSIYRPSIYGLRKPYLFLCGTSEGSRTDMREKERERENKGLIYFSLIAHSRRRQRD